MTDHKWSLKMPRPAPYRAHSLWRNCLHASAPWVWGFCAADTVAEIDDVTCTRAPWVTAPGAGSWVRFSEGRDIDAMGVAGVRSSWSAQNDTFYALNATATRLSATVLVNPNVQTVVTTVPIYKRRGSPYGVGNPGWHFSGGAGNQWRFSISDGATEINVLTGGAGAGGGGGARTQLVGRTDLLTATYDGANLKIYQQGELKGVTAGAINIPALTTQALNFHGVGGAGATFDGAIGMGMLHDRVLSMGEISALATDPFIAWRWPQGEDLAGGFYQTYFLSF